MGNTNSIQFWEDRLEKAIVRGVPRKALFDYTEENYDGMQERHQEFLDEHVLPGSSLLDAGCGIGLLYDILTVRKQLSRYVGIDFVPGFVEYASRRYPEVEFYVMDLINLSSFHDEEFDLCICRGVQGQIPNDVWPLMTVEMKRVAKKVVSLNVAVPPDDRIEWLK